MQNKYLIITAILITLFNVPSVTAAVHRVNNISAYNQYSGPTVFNSLNTAIGAASVFPNDTLYVEASATSYGVVTVNKPLTIIGTGYFLDLNSGLQNNQIASTLDNITFAAGSSGSTIMGLRIFGSGSPNVFLSNTPLNNITITRCYIQDRIEFQNLTSTNFNNIIITKNYVGHMICQGNSGNVTGLMVTNNFFSDLITLTAPFYGTMAQNIFTNGLDIQAGFDFFNNIFTGGALTPNNNSSTNMYNNVFSIGQPGWLTGGNNHFNIPYSNIFPPTGSPDGKLHPISGTCPECFQGYPGGTVEMGIYGGADPYILSGIPNIPTIYNLQAPPNAYPGGVVNTDISTRSNN